MIELPVCMATVQTMLGAKPDNERKSNNGVTNEIGVREMRAQTRSQRRGIHLRLRMHVLPRMHGHDGRGLPELRRRTGATAPLAERIVGQAHRLPERERRMRQAERLPYNFRICGDA